MIFNDLKCRVIGFFVKSEFRNILGKLTKNCLNNYNPFYTPCENYNL